MTNSKKKLITSPFKGPISALGGISGPIINPQTVSIPVIRRMINEGIQTFEVNPFNKDEKIRLTLSNVGKDNFAPQVNTAKPANTKKTINTQVKKDEKPVVIESDFQKK